MRIVYCVLRLLIRLSQVDGLRLVMYDERADVAFDKAFSAASGPLRVGRIIFKHDITFSKVSEVQRAYQFCTPGTTFEVGLDRRLSAYDAQVQWSRHTPSHCDTVHAISMPCGPGRDRAERLRRRAVSAHSVVRTQITSRNSYRKYFI